MIKPLIIDGQEYVRAEPYRNIIHDAMYEMTYSYMAEVPVPYPTVTSFEKRIKKLEGTANC